MAVSKKKKAFSLVEVLLATLLLVAALLILVADLFLMRGLGGQYFSPPPGILQRTPLASALQREADAEGGFRTMGYARNGTMHFLSDFPQNLIPSLAPPNLAMVYRLEDVQG
ncbi:MAG: hypothetical protein K6T29_11055, partial [Peptococcaceae bacterium]|nr:hypothetical protein [Peptococcaceae bacterium]